MRSRFGESPKLQFGADVRFELRHVTVCPTGCEPVMHASCQSLISRLATLDNGFTAGFGGAGNTPLARDRDNCRAPYATSVARRNTKATLSGPIRRNMAGMLVGTLSGGSRCLAPTTWGSHSVRNLDVSLAKLNPGALATSMQMGTRSLRLRYTCLLYDPQNTRFILRAQST